MSTQVGLTPEQRQALLNMQRGQNGYGNGAAQWMWDQRQKAQLQPKDGPYTYNLNNKDFGVRPIIPELGDRIKQTWDELDFSDVVNNVKNFFTSEPKSQYTTSFLGEPNFIYKNVPASRGSDTGMMKGPYKSHHDRPYITPEEWNGFIYGLSPEERTGSSTYDKPLGPEKISKEDKKKIKEGAKAIKKYTPWVGKSKAPSLTKPTFNKIKAPELDYEYRKNLRDQIAGLQDGEYNPTNVYARRLQELQDGKRGIDMKPLLAWHDSVYGGNLMAGYVDPNKARKEKLTELIKMKELEDAENQRMFDRSRENKALREKLQERLAVTDIDMAKLEASNQFEADKANLSQEGANDRAYFAADASMQNARFQQEAANARKSADLRDNIKQRESNEKIAQIQAASRAATSGAFKPAFTVGHVDGLVEEYTADTSGELAADYDDLRDVIESLHEVYLSGEGKGKINALGKNFQFGNPEAAIKSAIKIQAGHNGIWRIPKGSGVGPYDILNRAKADVYADILEVAMQNGIGIPDNLKQYIIERNKNKR